MDISNVFLDLGPSPLAQGLSPSAAFQPIGVTV